MATRPTSSSDTEWTKSDEEELKKFAEQNTPTRIIAFQLNKPVEGVLDKAKEIGVDVPPLK